MTGLAGRHRLALGLGAGGGGLLSFVATQSGFASTDGAATAGVGLGLAAGMLVGLLMAIRLGRWLDPLLGHEYGSGSSSASPPAWHSSWPSSDGATGTSPASSIPARFPGFPEAAGAFVLALWSGVVLGPGIGYRPVGSPNAVSRDSATVAHGPRMTLGLAGGFGLGEAVAIVGFEALEGPQTWQGPSYGLGFLAGMVVGFPIWRRVACRLGFPIFRRMRSWLLVGLVSGAALVFSMSWWWDIQWIPVPEAFDWLSVVLAAFVLGSWNAALFGFGFGPRFAWQSVDEAGRAPRPARRPADKARIGRHTERIPTDSQRRAKRSAGMSSPVECRPALSTGCRPRPDGAER